MSDKARGSNGRFLPDPETAHTDARVVDMWSRGFTQSEIASELGWSNHSTVSRAIDRAYAAIVAPSIDAARKRSVDRLDRAYGIARQASERDHVMVSQGRVVKHPDTGLPLLDDGPKLAAVDRIVKVEQRMAAVLGLDAPRKTSVDVVTRDSLVEQMERMAAELERNDLVTEDESEPVGASGDEHTPES